MDDLNSNSIDELELLGNSQIQNELNFDHHVRLATKLFNVECAGINLIRHDRWTCLASVGAELSGNIENTLCAHVLEQPDGELIIPATASSQYIEHPAVKAHNMGFYIGMQLKGSLDKPIGTFCLFGHESRRFSEEQLDKLRQFAQLLEKDLAERIRELALRRQTDWWHPITELPNRRLFMQRMIQAIGMSRANEQGLAILSIVPMGLARAKSIGGKKFEDAVLREIGQRLETHTRSGETERDADLVGHVGEDRFAVLLTGINDINRIPARIQEFLDLLGAPLRAYENEHYVQPYIGISYFDGLKTDTPDRNNSPDDPHDINYLEMAEAAVQLIKGDETETYRFYHELQQQQAEEELRLESSLSRAIEQEHFELVYQPQFNLQSGRIESAEVLLRWQHPEQGSISPTKFIPLLERTGLIKQVGEQLLRQALHDLAKWHQATGQTFRIAVNVAAQQLSDSEFPARLLSMIEQVGLKPDQVELEFTESTFIQHRDSELNVVNQLASSGIQLALDDFGTGYNAFDYLRRFPLNAVKIDRVFIQECENNDRTYKLIRGLTDLARSLDLRSVGEGIETPGQLASLKSTGCTLAQGFGLSHPVTADRIQVFIDGNEQPGLIHEPGQQYD